MHCHRSLLQIVARISRIVMVTENYVEASNHVGDCTLIELTDVFTECVPKPGVHGAWVKRK